jgi:Chlorite dismutase
MRPMEVRFFGGSRGEWRVTALAAITGDPLVPVRRLAAREAGAPAPGEALWCLRGVTSNERYVTRSEQRALASVQEPLGRPSANRAALIPITKSEAWWQLAQDERRAILEESSHHIATGLRYLPAIARRLHHGRDLGEQFDFLTWFEYAAADASAFEELVTVLRATEEWDYVVREIDIRLIREA